MASEASHLAPARESLVALEGGVRWRFIPSLAPELVAKYDHINATLYKCSGGKRRR